MNRYSFPANAVPPTATDGAGWMSNLKWLRERRAALVHSMLRDGYFVGAPGTPARTRKTNRGSTLAILDQRIRELEA